MADFTIALPALPALAYVEFADAATASRPSRVAELPDRAAYHAVAAPGALVTFSAILDGQNTPIGDDAFGPLFQFWPIEWPLLNGLPYQPPPASQDVCTVRLDTVGHYLFAMRHIEGNGYDAGGVVLVHIDVEAP